MHTDSLVGHHKLHFLRTGPRGGVPLVFLHALGLDLSIWEQQIRRFGDSHDVIAIDFPGHGLSEKMVEKPDFDVIAKKVLGLLCSLTKVQIDLVGISVGGMIAQGIAVLDPEKIRSLTLVATSCTFPETIRKVLTDRAAFARREGMQSLAPLHLERWFPQSFRYARPEVLDRFLKLLLRQDSNFHADMWDMVAKLKFKDSISSLDCQVLVVAGEEDVSASPLAAREIAETVRRGDLKVFPKCGHFPQVEYSDLFNDVLSTFLGH